MAERKKTRGTNNWADEVTNESRWKKSERKQKVRKQGSEPTVKV